MVVTAVTRRLARQTSAHSPLLEIFMLAPDTDLHMLAVSVIANTLTDPNLILLITRPPLPMRPPICAQAAVCAQYEERGSAAHHIAVHGYQCGHGVPGGRDDVSGNCIPRGCGPELWVIENCVDVTF